MGARRLAQRLSVAKSYQQEGFSCAECSQKILTPVERSDVGKGDACDDVLHKLKVDTFKQRQGDD
eukprot:7894177-Karenia_brevis.AAC.1